VHAHFTPPTTAQQRETTWHAQRAADFLAPDPYHWTPEAALASMEANGITTQLLSYLPATTQLLRESNDYGASLARLHPGRFALLAALPTNDPDACRTEIARSGTELAAAGFAVSTTRGGVALSDPSLDPVWAELDRRGAAIFVHPDTSIPSHMGLATPLIEVAFETTRVVVDMLYKRLFLRYPNISWVLAHCGGALPALSGRIALIGTMPWVRNDAGVTREELVEQMAGLYLDTAAAGTDANLAAALQMTTADHLVYGGDSGVPCTDDASVRRNIDALTDSTQLTTGQVRHIASRAADIFR
jgi:predicted TIM-barrel fold metal-dependent hydrolase